MEHKRPLSSVHIARVEGFHNDFLVLACNVPDMAERYLKDLVTTY